MTTTTPREVTALKGCLAIPAGDVHPSPANPRDRLHDIDDLARSIRERGLIQPIIVHPINRGYQIVAGHRRYAACRKLGYTTIPCIVRRPMAADQELLAMLVENGQRAGHDPIEEARAYRTLMDDGGVTIAAVGQQIGRPASLVSNRLMLLDLPQADQEELRAGHFALTYATGIVRAARETQRRRATPSPGASVDRRAPPRSRTSATPTPSPAASAPAATTPASRRSTRSAAAPVGKP